MAFRDNRQFVEALKKTGDVVCIKTQVDWDLEVGAISRRAMERMGPATFFENIKDYPDSRILAGVAATYRRVAIAMGLPPETPIREIYDEYERRDKQPIPPVVVKDGPCKENVMRGAEINLFRFSAPMCHSGDGGRYMGTWGFLVSKDPDTDWINWGTYRFMILDERTLSENPSAASNFATMFKSKYLPRNRPAPVALVVGEVLLPDDISEGDSREGGQELTRLRILNRGRLGSTGTGWR